jgi:streptomycin 6-kinase
VISVPQSFREMPRWWGGNERDWLERLPGLAEEQCSRWGLAVDGPVLHGSNALLVPVRRGDQPAMLRLAPPGDDVAAETAALRHWDGRGAVRLLDSDLENRATLLERLDHTRSLQGEPIREAVAIIGALTRTLAVAAPSSVTSTREIATDAAGSFETEWRELGQPVPRRILDAALEAARALSQLECAPVSVDGDLHFEQVLAGDRAPWIVVDPVLLRGDPEYDIGRVLWSRLDELPADRDLSEAFDIFVDAARVPPDRARAWVLVRSQSYLLWGLRHGLTLDPPRCRRLLEHFCRGVSAG